MNFEILGVFKLYKEVIVLLEFSQKIKSIRAFKYDIIEIWSMK